MQQTGDLGQIIERGRIITVFGSSRAQPGDSEYLAAARLGRLLAERGWTLCNGGFTGTMTAASQAAKEAGGTTIGVTVPTYFEGVANPWVDRNLAATSLFARLEQLVSLGDAYVVLHGGIGTLLELAMVWNEVQSDQAGKPVVIVGEEWAEVIRLLLERFPMRPGEAASLTLVPTVEAAVGHLEQHFARQQG